jgi:cytochrome c
MPGVKALPGATTPTDEPANCQSTTTIAAGQAVAASFDATGTLFVQTREPAAILQVGADDRTVTTLVSLSSDSRADTGHAVFNSNAGGNVACASCHLEGGDDARVWEFATIGPRRTQSLRGGISGTEPFHWDGDQRDFPALTKEVFEHRMSGPPLSDAQVAAASRWIDGIPARPTRAPKDAAAVARGQTLFEGAAQCTLCHNGAALTNNATLDVGTGGAFQVPSLRGVAWRAPYLHDGSAPTLADRFGAQGGGDKHGKTSKLTPDEISDLIAYLQTL